MIKGIGSVNKALFVSSTLEDANQIVITYNGIKITCVLP